MESRACTGNCLDEGTLLAPKTLVDTPGIEGFFKGVLSTWQNIFPPEVNYVDFIRRWSRLCAGARHQIILTLASHCFNTLPRRSQTRKPIRAFSSFSKRSILWPSQPIQTHSVVARRFDLSDWWALLQMLPVWWQLLTTFKTGRRALLQEYTKRDASYPAYAFLFATHVPGESPVLGVGHGTDLEFSKSRARIFHVACTRLLTNIDTYCLSNISLRRVRSIRPNIWTWKNLYTRIERLDQLCILPGSQRRWRYVLFLTGTRHPWLFYYHSLPSILSSLDI